MVEASAGTTGTVGWTFRGPYDPGLREQALKGGRKAAGLRSLTPLGIRPLSFCPLDSRILGQPPSCPKLLTAPDPGPQYLGLFLPLSGLWGSAFTQWNYGGQS